MHFQKKKKIKIVCEISNEIKHNFFYSQKIGVNKNTTQEKTTQEKIIKCQFG